MRRLKLEENARRAPPPPGARNGSHDVIDHVTIRFAMSFAIGGPLERNIYLQPFYRDIRPQHMLTNTLTENTQKRTNKHDRSQYLLSEIKYF